VNHLTKNSVLSFAAAGNDLSEEAQDGSPWLSVKVWQGFTPSQPAGRGRMPWVNPRGQILINQQSAPI
jgi:hypothetical protein